MDVIRKDFRRNKYIYLMLLPVMAYYLVFHYQPMYGVLMAFKNFSPGLGIWGSPWVGLRHLQDFVSGFYFWRTIRNTILINLYDIVFGFPAPIILALLLNEIRNAVFKRTAQTIVYLPHFISLVVVCGMVTDFTTKDGLFNTILRMFGQEPISFLLKPEWFRTIFVGSSIWQNVGWNSIIYLAALAGISPELYEAAKVDGANRFQQLRHITLPGIAPTIIILFILRIGHMMNVGLQKVLLLYNPITYETADVISTFVYRKGLLEANYSYSAAVGLFNAVISYTLLIIANRLSRKLTETSLW
ncbi:MAG: ABC transporter permease [Bacteroidota bacterium]